MDENEVELDSLIEIEKLKAQVKVYKSAFEQERIWRWVCWFMAFVIISRSIYDFWIK